MSHQFSDSKYCFRQSGGKIPTLSLAQSFWALSQREVPMDQALEDACAEDFEFFEVAFVKIGLLKEGNKSIPIVARLHGQERAQLGQIKNLCVYSSQQNTECHCFP